MSFKNYNTIHPTPLLLDTQLNREDATIPDQQSVVNSVNNSSEHGFGNGHIGIAPADPTNPAGPPGPPNDELEPLIRQPSPTINDQPNSIICTPCKAHLCMDCQRVLDDLQRREEYCERLYNVSPLKKAWYRMPAILLTMTLELGGGVIIGQFEETLKKFIVLSSFMPVISALSGNLGLQTSANIVRGLATGNVNASQMAKEVKKEIISGFFTSITVALILGSVATAWAHFEASPEEEKIHGYPFIFGGVVALGTLLSMMISSTNGSLTPFITSKMKLDPAKLAGPLETAFQDIAGNGFLLALAYGILGPLAKSKTPGPTTGA